MLALQRRGRQLSGVVVDRQVDHLQMILDRQLIWHLGDLADESTVTDEVFDSIDPAPEAEPGDILQIGHLQGPDIGTDQGPRHRMFGVGFQAVRQLPVPVCLAVIETDLLLQAVCKTIRKSEKYLLFDMAIYLAFVMLARCGMRINEPLRLRQEHYRADEGSVYIQRTKFRKDRLIPVPKAVLTQIENYLAVRRALCPEDQNPYLLAGKKLGIPVSGTMAHSFVQAFARDYEAFSAFAQLFPDRSVFLIDTYDTIAGARNAAQVGREMHARGHVLQGVRLDSGDMVAAFVDGGYEKGKRPPAVAVPEPTSVLLLSMGLTGLAIFRRPRES